MMTPRVIDISHHNDVVNFQLSADAGIWGIIHKATQGIAYRDPRYVTRRAGALKAGLLWGAYHFNTGDKVADQVANFMNYAKPDAKTLMVLDYEDNRLSNMNMAQAVEFLHLMEDALGRPAAIYSGNRLKENLASVPKADQDYIRSHRLWLCQYGARAVLPKGFTAWWLWQYTGDKIGPKPHSVPGIAGDGIDLNTFDGTKKQLTDTWA